MKYFLIITLIFLMKLKRPMIIILQCTATFKMVVLTHRDSNYKQKA